MELLTGRRKRQHLFEIPEFLKMKIPNLELMIDFIDSGQGVLPRVPVGRIPEQDGIGIWASSFWPSPVHHVQFRYDGEAQVHGPLCRGNPIKAPGRAHSPKWSQGQGRPLLLHDRGVDDVQLAHFVPFCGVPDCAVRRSPVSGPLGPHWWYGNYRLWDCEERTNEGYWREDERELS